MYLVNLACNFDEDGVVREIMAQAGPALLSVVVDLCADLETVRYSQLVRRIKSLSDAMIVAKLPLSASGLQVEKAFTAGFHALIFTVVDSAAMKFDTAATQIAVQIFPTGAVFLSVDGVMGEEQLTQVVCGGMVPLCDAPGNRVQGLLNKQGLDAKWLYFLGFYRNSASIGMKDKIVKKVMLETANLKHTLRVSQVEESYQSSSL